MTFREKPEPQFVPSEWPHTNKDNQKTQTIRKNQTQKAPKHKITILRKHKLFGSPTVPKNLLSPHPYGKIQRGKCKNPRSSYAFFSEPKMVKKMYVHPIKAQIAYLKYKTRLLTEPISLENPTATGTHFTKDERRKDAIGWTPNYCYQCEDKQCTRHRNGKFQECRIHIENDLRQAWRQTAHAKKYADYCQYCTVPMAKRTADGARDVPYEDSDLDPCHECQIQYHETSLDSISSQRI